MGPYDKFQESFEAFQLELKKELLEFRQELVREFEEKLEAFKKELAISLDTPVPTLIIKEPTDPPQDPKKTSWLDKKIF